MKSIFAKIIILLFIVLEMSCGGDIPDCPSQMCVLAGEWRLTQIYANGVLDTTVDLDKYKLTLLMPNPTTAITAIFNRINFGGTADTGTWEIGNNKTILKLTPQSGITEPYIIKSYTPRKIVLVIERDVNKTGPDEFEYVLEPF